MRTLYLGDDCNRNKRPPCYALILGIIASNGKKKKIAAATYTLFIIHLMLLFLFVFELSERASEKRACFNSIMFIWIKRIAKPTISHSLFLRISASQSSRFIKKRRKIVYNWLLPLRQPKQSSSSSLQSLLHSSSASKLFCRIEIGENECDNCLPMPIMFDLWFCSALSFSLTQSLSRASIFLCKELLWNWA